MTPSATDLAAWSAVVVAAQAAAKRPKAVGQPLMRAAAKAAKAVIPGGVGGGSPFLQLYRLGEHWGAKPEAERIRLAPELGRLADLCAGMLAGPHAPDPGALTRRILGESDD